LADVRGVVTLMPQRPPNNLAWRPQLAVAFHNALITQKVRQNIQQMLAHQH